MKLAEFRFVTGSAAKLAEARRIVGPAIQAVKLDLPEIQSLDSLEVARFKLRAAQSEIGGPVIVEESALDLDGWNGFPGPLVKWMLQALGVEGLAKVALMSGSARATARCLLLATDGQREWQGLGEVRGTLMLPARGRGGFGWDAVFVPDGETRTFGELPPELKDQMGHRGRAWRCLLEQFRADLTLSPHGSVTTGSACEDLPP